MNKIKSKYFTIFLMAMLVFITNCNLAQTKSTDVKTINGKKYYIHKVEKGQSLYAIAKTYNIDVNSVLAENDDAIDGLKNGQELKIPFESLLNKATPSIDTNKYVYHRILKGETVYAITKKYNLDDKTINAYNPTISKGIKEGEFLIVGEKSKISKTNTSINLGDTLLYTVDAGETLYGLNSKFNFTQGEILKSNPSLKDGIKQGQVLKIPKQKASKLNTATTTVNINQTTEALLAAQDTTTFNKPKKTAYNIGLFLPFKLNEIDAIDIDALSRNKSSFPAAQALAIDFYYGFKKAVDSLTAKDFDVTLRLFDVDEKDSSKIEMICKTSEFKKLDIIVGPFHSNGFKQMSLHAKTLAIPMISPVTQQNKILFNNPIASKVTPSQFTLIEGLADYCSDSLTFNSNVIIVNTTTKDLQYTKAFKKRFNDNLILKGKTASDSIREVKGIAGVKTVYSPNKKNIVIVLTNNHVYLQDFITQLANFASKKEVIMFGFNSVANIDNLDQEYLNKLQFHYATSSHIDYTIPETKQLAKQYQDVFFTDASENYFEGFDIGYYYLSNLKTQGPNFILSLDKIKSEGVTTTFQFYRPDAATGFENRAMSIYKYNDYKLVKTGWKSR